MQIFLKIEHVLVVTTFKLDYEYILNCLYIENVPRSTII